MTADELKRQVFPGESGGDYGALFGYSNRPGRTFGNVDLTRMTVNQAIEFSNPRGPYGQWVKDQIGRVATPMGAYQIVGTTLRAAKEGLGLSGNEVMTPELQDRLGMWIYGQQGPGAWEAWGRGGSSQPRSSAQTSSQGAPMAGLMDTGRVSAQNTPSAGLMGMSPEPQGFRERLMRDVRSGDFADNLTLALNSLRMRPDQGLADMVMQRQEQRAQERQANRTSEWLASIGRTDLAEAIGSGALDARLASVIAMTPQAAPEQTAAMQNYEFLRAQGVDEQTAMERSFGAGGTTVQNIMPGQPNIGTIPPGYQAVPNENGSWVMSPIPGSPAEQEALAAEEKAVNREVIQATRGDIVIQDIDRIFEIVESSNVPVTGFMGAMLQSVPGTSAANVNALLGGIKSVIAFDTIQQMRDNSPTGGALGTVSNLEINRLESAYGNLEQSQSKDQFLENLQRLQAIYTEIVHGPGVYEALQSATSAPGLQRPSSVPQSAWDEMTDEEKQLAIRLAGGVR
jgi:hypothetical protein